MLQIYDEDKQLRIAKGDEPFYFPFTHSRSERYDQCPRWYQYEYVDRLGKTKGDAAELGSALHIYQELLFTEGIEKASEIATAMVPLSMSEDWQNAKKIIDQMSIRKDNLYAAEAKFRYEFETIRVPSNGDPEKWTVQVTAKIDQLFVYPERGIAEVVDGKSGRRVEKDVRFDPQLKLYALASLKQLEGLDIRVVIGTQVQWRLGRLVSAEWTIDELKEFEVEIQQRATEILNDEEFRPSPGTQCMWCPFALRCDAAQTMLPKEVVIGGKTLPVLIDNDEDATKVASGVAHLEAILKRYRDSLRGYVREFGSPVKLGEKTYDFHRHKTLKIGDITEFLQATDRASISPENYLSFNNTTGKTLIKNHPEIKEALVEVQYEKFELRKPGEAEED